jgi:hypothetical protein
MNRAQSSTEFFILIGAFMFMFIVILGVIQENIAQKAIEKRTLEVQELALTAQNELNIAARATDGYSRQFILPQTIVNIDYNLTLVDNNTIYLTTIDGKNALALPGQAVVGDFVKGANTIRKSGGIIYLNIP